MTIIKNILQGLPCIGVSNPVSEEQAELDH